MELDSNDALHKKRTRSASIGAASRDTSGDDDSSSDAWSDLEHDNWLSQPDAESQAARLAARGSRTARYVRDVTPEKIDSKTPLKEDNVGMKMLKLMGWTPGGGLGARGTGRAEPVPLPEMMNGLGLGKANIETRMLAEAINQGPRVLESQKIAVETDAQRLAREAKVAVKAEVVATVQETLSKFHCDICSKGYANVAQWEEHLLSYGHNHAKRKKEVAMQSRSIRNNSDEVNKRREKEKKREQKELERILKATGGGLPTAPAASGSGSVPLTAAGAIPVAAPPEKKKGGFFKVASTSASPPHDSHSHPPPPPPSTAYAPPPPPPSNDQPPPPPPPADSRSLANAAPKFTSSKASNLQSTWTTWKAPPPTIVPTISSAPANASPDTSTARHASSWKPTTAPALHPLLAENSSVSTTSVDQPAASAGRKQWQPAARDQRNDFFRKEEEASLSHYELPTAASSINTSRAPKGMSFVSATARGPTAGSTSSVPPRPSGISLANGAPARKKALDMQDDDEDDEEGASGMPLPTGRPKARMPGFAGGGNQRGKIGFGSISK